MIKLTWRKSGSPEKEVTVWVRPSSISNMYKDGDFTVVNLTNGGCFTEIVEEPEKIMMLIRNLR